VKRIAISDRTGEISAILSQSTVVEFLSKHIDRLSGLENMTADGVLQWVGRKTLKSVCHASLISLLMFVRLNRNGHY